MATERKPLYISISDVHQFVLPVTASALGVDLNTGKQTYYNTSSLNWASQETYTGSYGIFSQITASQGITSSGNLSIGGTLATAGISIGGNVGAQALTVTGNANIGNDPLDITTIGGQLTASYGMRSNGIVSSSGNISTAGSLSVQGTASFTGHVILSSSSEVFFMTRSLTAVTTSFDYLAATIFYVSGTRTTNLAWNVTNVPTTSGRASSITFVIEQQPDLAISASTYQINGSAVTVKWPYGTIPVGQIANRNFPAIQEINNTLKTANTLSSDEILFKSNDVSSFSKPILK